MSDRLTEEALDQGTGGTVTTARYKRARWFAGLESGDVFGRDCNYDGPTLTVEIADAADAQEMLEAISMGDTVIDHLGDLVAHFAARATEWQRTALVALEENARVKTELAAARADIKELSAAGTALALEYDALRESLA